MNAAKQKGGRPAGSKNTAHSGRYSPSYATRLLKQFRFDEAENTCPTFEAFAVEIGTSLPVLRDWFHAEPDFATACQAAFTIQQAFLLSQIQANGKNAEFAKLFVQQPPFWRVAQ